MSGFTGKVISVYCCLPNEKVKSEKRDQLTLTIEGVERDKHFGRTKKAGGRETEFATRGEEVLNLRQVSIVSEQELSEIAVRMSVPQIYPEDLGANILMSDIPHLTSLPAGTYLSFPSGATLYVTSENLPCMGPGREIERRNSGAHGLVKRLLKTASFPKSALHKRGLVAMVFRPGVINPADSVRVVVPSRLYNNHVP